MLNNMLNKLVQAIVITSAVYLTMLVSQPQRPELFIEMQQRVKVAQFEHFLAVVIDFLRDPVQNRA
ncbi:hypothetical protein HJG54_08700 [Leptolyngbya sp. NK1-12]|uniref:Uncharacterized protein n=1 Tax=Leptolyngbya sp. NK1-12 TaxID=2547451 RepID=A0AA96WDG0_9CYAN|nr:hypothetical protein [Leptolyngbya sp. NK1-12]MBF2051140.1 hypothetical protein [Elainella sp. C42_A2020_010]WNZ22930.1 hypothetical protein HJG54_08700 [Leptolyngbya sp. NK1-12]